MKLVSNSLLDFLYNLQIRGKKQLIIFEPHNNTQLYEAHIPEALLGFNKQSKTFRRKTRLDSTSMVMAPVDILNPDFEVKVIFCYLMVTDLPDQSQTRRGVFYSANFSKSNLEYRRLLCTIDDTRYQIVCFTSSLYTR